VEVVASLSQGRTAAAQCVLFTHKSVPVIFEPPCNFNPRIKNTQEDRCDALLFDRRVSTFWTDTLHIFGLLLNIFYHEDQGSRLLQNASTHLSSTEHHSQETYCCENLKFRTARDGT